MKQLSFKFEKGKPNFEKQRNKKFNIPTFETWYAENSHERRQFGDRAYSKKKAVRVYSELLECGFFLSGRYKGGK